MDYVCSNCSIVLDKSEVQLSEQLPIGKLFCFLCQIKKEKEVINSLVKLETEDKNEIN